MISACAQITSARAKQPLASANDLSARKTASRAYQPLAKDVFTLSLKFNFGTMGEGTKAGRAFL